LVLDLAFLKFILEGSVKLPEETQKAAGEEGKKKGTLAAACEHCARESIVGDGL